MKLVGIILSQAVRLGKVSGKNGGNIYGLNLTKFCEQRYGFLQGPRDLADYNLSSGVKFFHGYFQERSVIDKLQVFENGVSVEAKIDTDECEAFLDDLLEWATKRGDMTFAPEPTAPSFS